MSVRENLVNSMITRVQSISIGTDYDQDFRRVTRDPIANEHLSDLKAGEAVAGIYEIGEDKTRLFNQTECNLHIVVEFYYKSKMGEVKATALNRCMSNLQKLFLSDLSQGGYAINTQEVSNEIDIDGIYDKIVNGSIRLTVTYRHGFYDPNKQIC